MIGIYDILQLILRYATEPVYTFIPQIPKNLYPQLKAELGPNPLATRYILKNLDKYSTEQIASNPHPRIIKEIMKRINEKNYTMSEFKNIIIKLASNINTDPDFTQYTQSIIFDFVDGAIFFQDCESILKSLFKVYKSKKFYDKYKNIYSDADSTVLAHGSYPYFSDVSIEENEQELIKIFEQLQKWTSIHPAQSVNYPPLVRELEIACGTSSKKSESEFLKEIINPLVSAEICKNPGAINILKADPSHIMPYHVSFNPRVGELIELGLIGIKDIRWDNLTTHNSNSLKIILDIFNQLGASKEDYLQLVKLQNSIYSLDAYGARLTKLVTREIHRQIN